jgi:hypothetical protein
VVAVRRGGDHLSGAGISSPVPARFCLFPLLPIFSFSLFWFVFSSHALFSRFVSDGGGASVSVPPEVVLVTVLVC